MNAHLHVDHGINVDRYDEPTLEKFAFDHYVDHTIWKESSTGENVNPYHRMKLFHTHAKGFSWPELQFTLYPEVGEKREG